MRAARGAAVLASVARGAAVVRAGAAGFVRFDDDVVAEEGAFFGADPATVSYKHGELCIRCKNDCASNHPLTLGGCGGAGAGWSPSVDPKGFPQLQSLGSGGKPVCMNLDSAKCAAGQEVHLFECQPASGRVHQGDHFAFNASAGTVRSVYCDAAGGAAEGGLCVSSAGSDGEKLVLIGCEDPAASGFVEVPWTPPPPTPAPTPVPPAPVPPPKKGAPNIVFFLTDDQDQVLGASFPETAPGGATPLPKTKRMINENGAVADNFYIHTPICCPSRAETLTGRYEHNVKLPVSEGQCGSGYSGHDSEGNACCMHVDEVLVNNVTMARYLKYEAGYTVGMFGKYLNVCPNKAPPGFDAWLANGGGSYFAPSFATENIDGLTDGTTKFNSTDYTTSVVGNYSIAWIKKAARSGRPWMAYIAPKAAHEPFQPAKWYADAWDPAWPAGAPRPPSFNVSAEVRADHHPTVAGAGMITPAAAECIDAKFKDRWRTLMSVDDVIEAVIETTEQLGVKNTTYFMYSSDHGYQLGELNLPLDKRNVYEFDIKIHLVMSGPGIKPGTRLTQLASNVDIAPTILSMAGLTVDMDGRSILPLVVDGSAAQLPDTVQTYLAAQPRDMVAAGWRDCHYVEFYHVGAGNYCGSKWTIDGTDNNYVAVRYLAGSKYGNILYAEFQNGGDGNIDFQSPYLVEMYDMDADPWQLDNVYAQRNATQPELVAALHKEVQARLVCKGASCP